jgi:uncharacterized protein (DUF1800 family)
MPVSTATPSLNAALAVTRFGLGGREGEMALAAADPGAFLKSQIRREGADQPQGPLKSSREMLQGVSEVRSVKSQAAPGQTPQALKAMKKSAFHELREAGEMEEILARARLQSTTDAGFRERWTMFWSNHFTASASKNYVALLAGPFEREAIRPNVFGRFEDMLMASSRHPAMLIYLDQDASVGPGSQMSGRGKKGLNENFAREVMELHTVGVDAGYTQADVTELARALTGWSSDYKAGHVTPFVYRPQAHEPGARTVMGKTYADNGEGQGRAILHDLAAHPATARHISLKLAQHFVADDPPKALTARLESAWTGSGGRLDVVAAALIDSPEAWSPQPMKFKTPYDFMVSSWRALGVMPADGLTVSRQALKLGQRPLAPPSPKGWSDAATDWASADQVMRRMEWSEDFAAKAPSQAAPQLIAANALGPLLGAKSSRAVAQAESRPQAIAVLLMSPEFQRR